MTKTTSYKISKQLKEAGFEAETDYNFIERNNQKVFLRNIKELTDIELMNEIGVFIKSYDLETLLDALPDSIQYKKYKSSNCYYLFLRAPSRYSETNKTLGYYCECNEYMDNYRMGEEDGIFEFSKLSPNESLADTAGKMWLLLKEKGLV